MARRNQSTFDAKLEQVVFSTFVATMIAEELILRRRPQRARGDLADATPAELSSPELPGDELIPVGYERRDTAASLAMLAGNIGIALATMNLTGGLDSWAYRKRFMTVAARKRSWLAALVAWDFLYYWEHRWMHEVRLFWANHVTHHSSEHYNLSTALRQPWSAYMMHWVFLPMPLLGFSPSMTRRAGEINLLYQYWVHTELVDRLPVVGEAVLNTPSHHRVHHGANPQYLDKNYAGILILWDKLFGTFEPEVRRVKYGLTKNIDTFNPLKIGYHEFIDIGRDVRSAKGLKHKLGYVFRAPGWQPTAVSA